MLCACRAGSLWLRLLIATLAVLLTLAGWVGGQGPWTKPLRTEEPLPAACLDVPAWVEHHVNSAQVNRELDTGALVVARGTELDPAEFQMLEAMLVARACRDRGNLLHDELFVLRNSLKAALKRMPDPQRGRIIEALSEDRLLEALRTSVMTGKPAGVSTDDLEVEVGFARYQNWKTVWLLKPVEGTEKEEAFQVRYEAREQSLPCTRQAYIRLLPKGGQRDR